MNAPSEETEAHADCVERVVAENSHEFTPAMRRLLHAHARHLRKLAKMHEDTHGRIGDLSDALEDHVRTGKEWRRSVSTVLFGNPREGIMGLAHMERALKKAVAIIVSAIAAMGAVILFVIEVWDRVPH